MLYLRIFYICSSYTYFPLHDYAVEDESPLNDYARGVDRGVFAVEDESSLHFFCLNLFNKILRILTM